MEKYLEQLNRRIEMLENEIRGLNARILRLEKKLDVGNKLGS